MTYLFRAEFMGGLHEVCTDHWEGYTESVLGWELHALLELVLKYGSVKTENV